MIAHKGPDGALAGAELFPRAYLALGMPEAEIERTFGDRGDLGGRALSLQGRKRALPKHPPVVNRSLHESAAVPGPELARPPDNPAFRRLVELAELGKRIDRLVIGEGASAAWARPCADAAAMPILDNPRPARRPSPLSIYQCDQSEVFSSMRSGSPNASQSLTPRGYQPLALDAEYTVAVSESAGDDRRAIEFEVQPIAGLPRAKGRSGTGGIDEIIQPDRPDPSYEPSLALVASQIRAQQMARLTPRPAATGRRGTGADGRVLALEGAIQEAQPVAIQDFFYEPASEPLEIPAHRSALRGQRLRLGRSRADIGVGEAGTSLNIRNRSAALTFGVPSSGFFYRIQLTSSRIQAYAPAEEGGARLGPWPVLLAMIAAGTLLFWSLAPRNASHGLARAMATQSATPDAARPAPPAPPQTAPAAKAQAAPPVQEQQIAEPVQGQQKNAAAPPPVAAPPQERVATSKTANIRARPEMRAPVARVVPAKVILTVFAKKDDWLEVGSTYAWGWVHSSSIYRYDPSS